MSEFSDIFPNRETLLQLETEDVAVLLLKYFNAQADRGALVHRLNLFGHDSDIGRYAGDIRADVLKVLSEGWQWLEGKGLIALAPDDSTLLQHFVTRRGRKLRSDADFGAFKLGSLLDPKSLDPTLAQKVTHLFTRGDYDTAIFQAYKEVEVRVRKACAEKSQPVADEIIGIKLMSEAFDLIKGPLRNQQAIEGEKIAMRNLFVGAIGLFKNPSSHRDVKLAALEASELIHFANHLLRIADSA
jgi:uncharacterized protein (TIGR02391 family)